MRMEILVKIIERLLGAFDKEEENPADVYLPKRLLSMAMVLFLAAAVCAVAAVAGAAQERLIWFAGAAVMLVMSIAACLCWKNQKAVMLDDETFSYTTMFGKMTVHRFEDIVTLRRNRDSYTLMLRTGKVHIESMAVVSERFADRISAEFEKEE